MKEHNYYVYLIASDSGTLYVGVTNDLERRVREHQTGELGGFTKKYHCHKLVYFEEAGDIQVAIEREKQLKNWRRNKKVALIRTINPGWEDLSEEWK